VKPKYTRFQDIPQFTRSASYQVNVSWGYLEEHLNHLNDNGLLDLDPDFQRAHVWTEDKQRAYVEFVLRGGHSSKVIQFNCSSWMKNFNTPIELVDGKQRLESVRKFMRNELAIFGGCRYCDFKDKLRISTADFIFCVNDLETRAEVLQWYLDLNTGGVVHTSEEIEKVKKLLEVEGRK
jgi:hypothetical protein